MNGIRKGLINKLIIISSCAFSLGEDNIPAKILSYNRANRAVAILCNHQRAPPKTFEKSMQNLQAKVRLGVKPEMEVGLVSHFAEFDRPVETLPK